MNRLLFLFLLFVPTVFYTGCKKNIRQEQQRDVPATSMTGNTTLPSVSIGGITQMRYFDYPPGNTNRLFIGVACGNFDGSGVATIAMLKKESSQIIFMRTGNDGQHYQIPFSFDISTSDNDFKAIAAGDVDGDGIDELVVLRSSPTTDLLVYDIPANFSGTATLKTSLKVGSGLNDWKGLAVADFNGDGKADIAVLKGSVSQIIIYQVSGSTLSLGAYQNLSTDTTANQWSGIAGGDLDGDGKAELLAVRYGSGSYDDFLFYKFNGWTMTAAGSFNFNGGTTHYPWRSVAIGEFDNNKANGKEFVVYKNSHSFFIYQNYINSTTPPSIMGGQDFSSDTAYPWTGIAAGQIQLNTGGEQLVAIRQKPSDGTIAAFGNETDAFTSKKANLSKNNFSFGTYWQGLPSMRNSDGTLNVTALKNFCDSNKLYTFAFLVAERWKDASGVYPPAGTEYVSLVEFLDLLKNSNSPIKVIPVLAPPTESNSTSSLLPNPGDSPLIGATELGSGITDERTLFQGTPKANDFVAWFKLLGIIGNKYPNMAGINIDDFNGNVGEISGFFNRTKLGSMIRELRNNNEVIAFLPTVYYDVMNGSNLWVREYTDGFTYYFRNQSGYTGGTSITPTVIIPPDTLRPVTSTFNMHGAVALPSALIAGGQNYVNKELNSMSSWIANSNKLLFLGIYASTHSQSRTAPTAFTTGGLMDQAKTNTNCSGLMIYLSQDPSSAIGQAVYSRFNSW
ncbi:MAG: VCBS repeat-containing protein [Niabella sp.]|nr:VCBS repeat-containing protein [Niabella sp.]